MAEQTVGTDVEGVRGNEGVELAGKDLLDKMVIGPICSLSDPDEVFVIATVVLPKLAMVPAATMVNIRERDLGDVRLVISGEPFVDAFVNANRVVRRMTEILTNGGEVNEDPFSTTVRKIMDRLDQEMRWVVVSMMGSKLSRLSFDKDAQRQRFESVASMVNVLFEDSDYQQAMNQHFDSLRGRLAQ
jgi:hypothetical protein